MGYSDRLNQYEQEKKKLKNLSASEYEKQIKILVKKWRL
jgi:hypothetical protein